MRRTSFTNKVKRNMSAQDQEQALIDAGYKKLKLYPDELQVGDYILLSGEGQSSEWVATMLGRLYRDNDPDNVFPGITHWEVPLQQGCYVSLNPNRKTTAYRRGEQEE